MAETIDIDISDGLRKLSTTDAERIYEHAKGLALDGDYDLALVKIKPVVHLYPGYPQAVKLMALLCLKTGDPVKAYMVLTQYKENYGKEDEQAGLILKQTEDYARKNGYLLKTEAKARAKKEKREKQNVIVPVHSRGYDLFHDFLCISGGLILGFLACMYLVFPSVKQQLITENNSQLMNYSEQMQSKEVEIRSQQAEIESLKASLEETQKNLEVYTGDNGVMASYATLISCMEYFVQEDYLSASSAFAKLDAKAVNDEAYKKAYNAMKTQLATNGVEILVEKGRAYYKKYNYDEAIKYYEEALKLKSDYPELLYNLGLCYYNKRDKETAAKYFYKVQKEYPESVWARNASKVMKYTPDSSETGE